jgi:cytochrome c oxidase cbb3-type subunit III
MRLLLAIALLCSCEREQRTPPPRTSDHRPVRLDTVTQALAGYAETAETVANGRKLYSMFNCIGCHANGGGGMGPALMDERWIYGSTPQDVATTIVAGRSDGMPAYAGKLVPSQLHELIAFVRSLGGLVRTDALSARSDHIQTTPAPTLRDVAVPQPSKSSP